MKRFTRKSISVLLSLLLVLSVLGGLAFSASAEGAETHNVILQGNADSYADSVIVSVSPTEAAEGDLVTVSIQKKANCVKKIYTPYCYFTTDGNITSYEDLSYEDYESFEWDSDTGEFTGTFRMPAQDVYVYYYINSVDMQHEYGAWAYSHQETTDDGDVYTGARVCAVCGAADPETRTIFLRGNADRYADEVNVSISADEATEGDLVIVSIRKKTDCVTKLNIPYCYFTTDGNITGYEGLSYADYEYYEWVSGTGEFTGTFRMSGQDVYVFYYINSVDATHALVDHDAQAPTCTEIGWDAYRTCENCDYTEYVEIPANGHTYVNHEAQAPTCTEIGWEAYRTCENCDYTSYVEIPATGNHVYGTIGAARYTCRVCGTVDAQRKAAFDQAAAADVIALIDAIGEVKDTDSSHQKILAARDAYDKLTDVQKALVTNYATLQQAEARYYELTELPCKYCGEIHDSSLGGGFTAIFHAILYFFAHLFGLK